MAEIDVDKILEKTEKVEKKTKYKMYLIIGGVILISIIVLVTIISKIIGENSLKYFPLKSGNKYVYNKKNMNPEEWEILDKTENIKGYTCKIINKTDKGTYLSIQDYYYTGKKGIVKLAYSKNFGKKKKTLFRLLPYRIKKGIIFNAGKIKGITIKGEVINKEKVSTPVGVFDTYKVKYKADGYMDKEIWYAKDVGIIKIIDKKNSYQIDLISMVQK